MCVLYLALKVYRLEVVFPRSWTALALTVIAVLSQERTAGTVPILGMILTSILLPGSS